MNLMLANDVAYLMPTFLDTSDVLELNFEISRKLQVHFIPAFLSNYVVKDLS